MNNKTITISVSSIIVLLALAAGGGLWYLFAQNPKWFEPEAKAATVTQTQVNKPAKPMLKPSAGQAGKQANPQTTTKTGKSMTTPTAGQTVKQTNSQTEQKTPTADFGPYMRKMQRKIKLNWNPPKKEKSNSVTLLYTLDRKGKVIKCKVLKSSGSKDTDNAAKKALYEAAPFGDLPPEFKGLSIDVQFTFDYNGFGSSIKQ